MSGGGGKGEKREILSEVGPDQGSGLEQPGAAVNTRVSEVACRSDVFHTGAERNLENRWSTTGRQVGSENCRVDDWEVRRWRSGRYGLDYDWEKRGSRDGGGGGEDGLLNVSGRLDK